MPVQPNPERETVEGPVSRQDYSAWSIDRCCRVIACPRHLVFLDLDLRAALGAVVQVGELGEKHQVSVMTSWLARNCGVIEAEAPMVMELFSAP